MNTVFKINDRVYCSLYEQWGTIIEIMQSGTYCIIVEFDNMEVKSYTSDGRYSINFAPTLGFTEVKIEVNQVRPLPEIEKGQLIYVKLNERSCWDMRYFSHFKGSLVYCFNNQLKEGATFKWPIYSLTNPLEEK